MHRIPLQGGLSSRARQRLVPWGLLTAAAFAAGSLTSMAGTATYDFTTDPSTDPNIIITGNNDAPYQATGGNTGGFLVITYPQGGQNTTVIFPDIDDGKLVKAFKFEADLRVGNSTGDRAADGFSVSFARGNDPLLADPANASGFAGGGPAEFGTGTGIAVSFDTWSGNVLPDTTDIEGIIVRVDNVTVNKTDLPTRHGACDDNTSLQTGPRDAAYWTAGGDPRDPASWAGLCWQPFLIDLDDTGKLTVSWKGRLILDKYQTTYFPSVGRLVLAGRTGGANEHTHFDNIKITTVQADQPIVGLPQGSSCDFSYPIADAGTVSPNVATLQVRFNGAVVPVTTAREGANTIVSVVAPSVLAAGSTNTVETSFTTSTGGTVTATRQYVAPASTTIPASAKAASFVAGSSGFTVRTHWMSATGRGPGDANTIANAEAQLGGRFVDNAETAVPNDASPTDATVETINWDQAAGDFGGGDNFNSLEPEASPVPNEAIPGVSAGNESNIATEILTFLELPVGCHTLGVNSDDGFLVTLGHSQHGVRLGAFDGGRGAADTTFRIIVQEAGVYPIRLSWWEGGGGANVEFFSVTPAGQKILINDRANTAGIKAYSQGQAPGALLDFGATRTAAASTPTAKVIASFRDGSTTVDAASLVMRVDGAAVTPVAATAGGIRTFTYTPAAPYGLGSSHTASLVYTIGGVTATNNTTFTIRLGGFFIEAEHYNYDGGSSIAAVNTMPYEGGEYQGLGAVHDTDYHQTYDEQDPGSLGYREGDTPNVPMDSQTGADLDTQRGDFSVTTNYKIGWANDGPAPGDWYNYTRTFTNGNYYVYAAQSHGEPNLPDRQRLRVTVLGIGGSETTIGSYSRPGSSGWGNNTINQLMVGPVPAVVTLGGQQTIRAYQREGDFDWFVFVPTTNPLPAQQFIIEAEDFNYGSGQTVAEASTMPLTGAPYASVAAAVPEIDYHVIGDVQDAGAQLYRVGESPNAPMNENDGRTQGDRGTYVRSPNFKIGWTDAGEWFNYTRTFPQANFNVWAAMSHGDAGPTAGSLQLVTSGATTTTQTVQELGTFFATGGTGGWGPNRLVPLQANGQNAVVALGGAQTVRFTVGPGGAAGDIDYLVFVPTTVGPTPTQPNITAVSRSGTDITITWTGGGTLQSSDVVGTGANWQAVAGAGAGTATVPIAGGQKFFRILAP